MIPQLDFCWRHRLLGKLPQFENGFLHVYVYDSTLRQGKYCCVEVGTTHRDLLLYSKLDKNKTFYFYYDLLTAFCMHAPFLTFSLRKTDPLPDPLSLISFGIPTLNLGSPPHPTPLVTRAGVRGLIICTDPGLSPRGGCFGTVALDPIDTV